MIGGGNIGTQFACVCASKGYKVNVYSSRPEAYDGVLEIVDERDHVIKGKLNKVTANLEEALEGCGFVFITYPAFRFREIADRMFPHILASEASICVVPGTGGAEFAFGKYIRAGVTLAGLQRVPSVARLEKYGKRVRCEGLRDKLALGTIPGGKTGELAEFIASLFDIPCVELPNYLSVTLTPSNPILHTTRLRILFADYEPGKIYRSNPLFYGEWNDDSSMLLLKCDEELQQICRILKNLDLSKVRSLKLHYQSPTVQAMTAKIRSIKSLHHLRSPMEQRDGGWIPDFQSRYFMADFPYGLAIIESLADILCADAPNIRATMDWYRNTTGDKGLFSLADYDLRTVDDLYSLYS